MCSKTQSNEPTTCDKYLELLIAKNQIPNNIVYKGKCSSLITNNAIMTTMILPQSHLTSYHLCDQANKSS